MNAKTYLLAVAAGLAIAFSAPAAAKSPEAERQAAFLADFAAADRSADGALDVGEFRAFIDLRANAGFGRAARVRSMGMQDRVFARIDADRDGRLTTEEFVAMRRR